MDSDFRQIVWDFYRDNNRDMPWRKNPTFYNVLVSEIMLQQTQVERVRGKYSQFMDEFASLEDLAAAKLSDVLKVWQGLGYNRRAKYLHESAKKCADRGVPKTINQMVELPGIGKNTAAALMNYVYNSPTPFVETNIRTVYFHHFFHDSISVYDSAIIQKVDETMDRENPREWFWALMDYGTWLKKQGLGRLDVSSHYKKQPPLEGSVRQTRGKILTALVAANYELGDLEKLVKAGARFGPAIAGLQKDGLIFIDKGQVRLTD